MAEKGAKVPVKTEKKAEAAVPAPVGEEARHPLLALRQEMDRLWRETDRLFEDFFSGFPRFGRRAFDIEPFRRLQTAFGAGLPVVDLVEKEKEYEVSAELPGLEEKDIELTLSDNLLTIKGEKKEEKEEKQADYHLSERRYGAFQRSFRLREGVDADKIAANFRKGVLTVTLPKTEQALKRQRKIAIKAE